MNWANNSAAGGLVIIALGSNLGDSHQILAAAMDRLKALSPAPFLASSLWQTSPVDCPPGSPPFLNAVVGFPAAAGEKPEGMLRTLQALELEFGRRPKQVLNEPRPLDLDLIAFGDEIRQSPELVLPHPRAHRRQFVLGPLSEIAPDLILPGQVKTVAQLRKALRSRERMECVGAPRPTRSK
jgi:2-amino-4-hydroxy-6-hydroxymethyldihydropteridine diphosphokinase